LTHTNNYLQKMLNNNRKGLSILFIGKVNDPYSKQAADFLVLHYPDAWVIFSSRNDPFPEELKDWEGDVIISYLAQWIIPQWLLEKAKIAALNLHPGPPEYPGIGCTNFAIYNEADTFGITCHHMLSKVDSGNIVTVKRFPVFEEDTVYSITQRCYVLILDVFYEVMYTLMRGEELPESGETWQRKPYKRTQLDELCTLKPDMDKKEITRRIKATYYLKHWAIMKDGDKSYPVTEELLQKYK
jgi:methionyl-tRNA formyltransferase